MVIRLFFLLSLLFLNQSVYGELGKNHSREVPSILTLDNLTVASYDDIADDPFLVLRKKVNSREPAVDVAKSWEYFANFDVFSLKPIPQIDSQKEFEFEGTASEVSISVANTQNVFDHIIPTFYLASQSNCEQIWWQISINDTFDGIISNFEGIQEFNEVITLDKLTDTFFNPETTYYFRVKGMLEGNWGQWSSPYTFQVVKPHSVKGIVFNKVDENLFTIRWDGAPESDTHYLVFGSNSLDFIPSIYYDKQINHIENGEIVDFSSNENLIEFTKKTSVQIDDRFAYYRIVAEKNGRTSVPSSIINVFDDGLSIPRDVLQKISSSEEEDEDLTDKTLKRISFPTAYNYVQAKSIPLLSAIEDRNDFLTLNEKIRRQIEKTKKFDPLTYTSNPYVSADIWNAMAPYFLPENHPVKARLDRIFNSGKRITVNSATLKSAGFIKILPRPYSKCVVTTHPKILGFYIKLFMDSQVGISDWYLLSNRVIGANGVREAIARLGFKKYFYVPQKWIYPLPPEPSPPPGCERKNFILIAEELNIVSSSENRSIWRNDNLMTKEKLRSFYILVRDQGLFDSVHAPNAPFSMDGKICFIDTEHHHGAMYYPKLLPFLGKKGQVWWQEIVASDGN